MLDQRVDALSGVDARSASRCSLRPRPSFCDARIAPRSDNYTTQHSKGNTPTNATHGNTYTVLLRSHRRLPQAFTQTPMKRGVATSPSVRRPSLTAPRVPPAWGTGLVPARARLAGSRRSGFGPSPPSHATPQRLRPPRHSRLHTTPSLLRTVPENNSLSRLREQLSPQPDSLLSSQPPSP